MDIIETIALLKTRADALSDPEFARRFSELETQVRTLIDRDREALARTQAREAQFTARIRAIRHDVAQPVTVIQTFLELMPVVLQEDGFQPEQSLNPDFWK